MKYRKVRTLIAAGLLAIAMAADSVYAAEPQVSARMEKAKDYIAEEQWVRAIELLKGAAGDPKEKSQDEALFWLAHSQHQAGQLSDALQTIAELERRFAGKSRWVKPALSLRVELAQKLRRNDVLVWYATPAPVAPAPAGTPPPTIPRPSRPTAVGAGGRTTVTSAPVPPPPAEAPPAPAPRAAAPPMRVPRGAAPAPATLWMSEYSVADTDLRIQALGSLIHTDAPRVIPMLRSIALESKNPGEASRAVFVLAQSGKPEAQSTVLELAKRAPEPVSVAAVRELGRFGGPGVQVQLLEVYEVANPRVKYQIVSSLGERSAATALMQIAQAESDRNLRETAIIALGRAGGRDQLQRLYRRASVDVKRPIITGLFNARAEDELIEIARTEKNLSIRREVLARLRLLGTPKAKAYLEKTRTSR